MGDLGWTRYISDVEKAESGKRIAKVATKRVGHRKVCQCRPDEDCPHDYPVYIGDTLINPMKAGATYTDEFGNDC